MLITPGLFLHYGLTAGFTQFGLCGGRSLPTSIQVLREGGACLGVHKAAAGLSTLAYSECLFRQDPSEYVSVLILLYFFAVLSHYLAVLTTVRNL